MRGWGLVFALAWWPTIASAAPVGSSSEVHASIEGNPEMHTGDALTLTLRATVGAEDEVAVPKQSFAPFEVLGKNVKVVGSPEGMRTFEFRLVLLALEPGSHRLGPVRLQIVRRDGTIETQETNAVDVDVASVLGNEPNAEPAPPTPPVPVLEEDFTLLYVGLALLGIAAVALGTLVIARHLERRRARALPPPPPRPAWEVAFDALGGLRRDLTSAFAEGRGVSWIDHLSDALRAYLGARFGFEGLESTTDETLARLREARLRGTSVPEIATILGECDLVKFANVSPDEDRARSLLESAERVVRATTIDASFDPPPTSEDLVASRDRSSTSPKSPAEEERRP